MRQFSWKKSSHNHRCLLLMLKELFTFPLVLLFFDPVLLLGNQRNKNSNGFLPIHFFEIIVICSIQCLLLSKMVDLRDVLINDLKLNDLATRTVYLEIYRILETCKHHVNLICKKGN